MTRALAALFGVLVFAAAARAQVAPRVGIFLDFDNAPGRELLQAMQREVTDQLKPAGLSPAFVIGGHSGESYQGLIVVKIKGKCSVERWRSDEPLATKKPVPLASTVVEGGHVLPFSSVRCDQLRRGVASSVDPKAGRKQQQTAMGLAMGRVVAHELYHVLARTTGHAAQGLAKATHELGELAGEKLTFATGDLSRMTGRD